MDNQRPPFELDIENLEGFFQVKLLDERGFVIHNFAQFDDYRLDVQGLANVLAQCTIYTFNGNNYDLPILVLALSGADNATLKAAGDAIIQGTKKYPKGIPPWKFYEEYNLAIPEWIDHVDLMEAAPGVRIGLKTYGGRMHSETIQDLPKSPHEWVWPHERIIISEYCDNDLVTTNSLRHTIAKRLALREALSKEYKTDVRSKSDAQIAEAVFKAKLDFYVQKRYIAHGYTFNYTPPDHIRFVTPALQELLHIVRTAPFVVTDKEEALILWGIESGIKTGVQIPDALKGRDIRINHGVYRMGIGGLHSQESCAAWRTIPGVQTIIDIDVKSYYPSLILAQGMVPAQLGEAFSIIYRTIYDRRLLSKSEAKRIRKLAEYWSHEARDEMLALVEELETTADGLKIVLNGVFGKLFSKWSIFYAPELGIAVTVGGQLSLLMLIEMMELTGIRVVSANTDGIVLCVPAGKEDIARSNVAWWERITRLEMEESQYAGIFSRDVNNYFAITTDGEVKRKGVFATSGVLSGPQGKTPDKDVCADAVIAFVKDGTPIEQTIRQCQDVRKFVVVRGATGGAVYVPAGCTIDTPGLQYMGKVCRWYFGTAPGYIAYKNSGNKVAGSDNAVPAMRLPIHVPPDIDYQHYIDVSNKMLAECGVTA